MNDPRVDEPKDDPNGTSTSASEPAEETRPEPAAVEENGRASATYASQATPGRSFSIVLGLFALLIAIAAAGGIAFTWWEVAEQQEIVATQRSEASATLADIRDLVEESEERLAILEERLATIDRSADARRNSLDAMDAELKQARARLDALSAEDAQDAAVERSPSLAEIEFLLLLARRELALADNPRVALAALREADQRVARLDDPGLGEVRSAINDEIAAVEAVASVDLEGIAMRLASLAGRVDGLPLRASLAPDVQAARQADELSGWARLKQRVRAAAAGLFRIRRTDAPAPPLLAPDESFFLYRNIELDLRSARLAVLSRDARNFAASLAAARNGLAEYFETGDEAVQSVIAAIEELEDRDIAPQWPEISRSLALLRTAGATD